MEEQVTNPKERAYDEHVAPLMTQIIELCKQHKINMFADFSLDDDGENGPLYCTTALPQEDLADKTGGNRMMRYYRIAREKPFISMLTIVTDGRGGVP